MANLTTNPVIQANEAFLQTHGSSLQAGIFSPHNREHVLLLFITAKATGEKKRQLFELLNGLARNSETRQGLYLTSYRQNSKLQSEYQVESNNPELFLNIFLSAEGLEYFGAKGEAWDAISAELQGNRQDLTGEAGWEPLYQNRQQQIHALILLAHAKKDALLNAQERLKNYFQRLDVDFVIRETGKVYRQRFFSNQTNGFALEHFGYADGLSNPWVTEKDTKLKDGTLKPTVNWDPTCSVNDFLVPEFTGETAANDSFGSYLTYRKMEQHVEAFRTAAEKLKNLLPGASAADVESLAFGREKNGIPLESGIQNPADSNDFRFSGNTCPMFAHIRMVNPRLQKKTSIHVIRRGVTYGERKLLNGNMGFDPASLLQKPVGLLFMSFQKDLSKFQAILNRCQKPEFDPLVGILNAPERVVNRKITNPRNPQQQINHAGFAGFASLRGGFNFYAPSLRFFEELKLEAY